MTDQTTEALRHKLIADLFDLPIWYQGNERRVTPWHSLTIKERDLIADALKQWRSMTRPPAADKFS